MKNVTPRLKPQEWLSTISDHYLRDFISNGGAAVKFVVPGEESDLLQALAGLESASKDAHFQYVYLSAASVRIHLIHELFFQVARQMDWDDLAYSFLCRSLRDHYKLPDSRQDFSLKTLASLNSCEEPEMRRSVNERLKSDLFKDYAMTQEFRLAMLRLCQAWLDPGEVSPELRDAVKAWLHGELRLVSALKPALIFQKIGRHNARHLLFSLSHWLRLSGRSGLVLALDISRYLEDRPRQAQPDGSYYYGKAAMLECYEVLRQFIDGTDESESLFLVAFAPPRFLAEDERRGVKEYDALKLRIWDEVRDRKRVNPLSSLVRISSCA